MHNGAHVHSGIRKKGMNHKGGGMHAKSSVRKEGRDDCSKRSTRDRERLAPYGITSRCNLKTGTNGRTAQRHRLTDLEKKLLGIKI